MSAILALLAVGLVIATLLAFPSGLRKNQGVPLYEPDERPAANETPRG